ncbi:MAG: metal-sensitive transcriptional regulator [Burkholderiaceae bacterium]
MSSERPGTASLKQPDSRDDITKRLRRIEGQVRGIVRMIESDAPCMEVAQQLSAVRKAMDSVFARMTVCYLQQELGDELAGGDKERLDRALGELGTLLRRMA